MSVELNQAVKTPPNPVSYAGVAVKTMAKGAVQASVGFADSTIAKVGLVVAAMLIADYYGYLEQHTPCQFR